MIRCLLVTAMIILTPPKGNGGMPLAPKPAVIEARVWDKLAAAISFVESRNDDRAYNASSGALGRWQMKKVYVDEVNRIYCMDEVEEPTDDDWLNAVSNLFDSYTYDVKNTDVDKFKMSDVMNVYRIINL